MAGPTTARKPVIRKAVKQARQALARGARNQMVRNEMKSLIKIFFVHVQAKEVEKASKILPKVVSAIDMAYKNNLIHRNNAARKKSHLQKSLTRLQKSGETPKTVVEKEAKAKAEKAAKKAAKPSTKKAAKK